MGQYVYNLSKIESREAGGGVAGIVPPDSYIVCIVDSRRYPQTAEHIKAAQKSGMPELVTIGRSEASRRRKQSLAGVELALSMIGMSIPWHCFAKVVQAQI